MEQQKNPRTERTDRPSASFLTGVIALVFLVIGYQTALFVHQAAVARIVSVRDHPDTVYVVDRSLAESILRDAPGGIPSPPPSAPARPGGGNVTLRRNAPHAPETVRLAGRRVENFRFDPNTVSAEDLQRLGFSERQAAAILRYREAGGRFRRKADFAKS